MQSQVDHFYSDGLKLACSFFRPDSWKPPRPQPLVIACSGFTGLCRIHPERFARYLTGRGWQCFGFDYRGFADSEGQSGRVLLEEQVRDIQAATAYVAENPQVDAQSIILLGWGMGAGLVLDAAKNLPGMPQVAGLAAINGFYNGQRLQEAHRDDAEMERFLTEVADERIQRARTGNARHVDPFELYPLDAQSRQYVDNVLRKTPDYNATSYSFELADSLLRWDAEAHAPQMDIPLLVIHGDENRLHPPQEAESLLASYAGPKQLHWIEAAGHTEFMHDENPKFQAMAEHLEHWLRHLREPDEWT